MDYRSADRWRRLAGCHDSVADDADDGEDADARNERAEREASAANEANACEASCADDSSGRQCEDRAADALAGQA